MWFWWGHSDLVGSMTPPKAQKDPTKIEYDFFRATEKQGPYQKGENGPTKRAKMTLPKPKTLPNVHGI